MGFNREIGKVLLALIADCNIQHFQVDHGDAAWLVFNWTRHPYTASPMQNAWRDSLMQLLSDCKQRFLHREMVGRY